MAHARGAIPNEPTRCRAKPALNETLRRRVSHSFLEICRSMREKEKEEIKWYAACLSVPTTETQWGPDVL